MGKVVWRRAAASDLGSIFDYIAAGSPERAATFLERLIDFAELPKTRSSDRRDSPIYRNCGFIRSETMSLSYRPTDDGVEIVRLIHGARDYHAVMRVIEDDGE